MYKYGFALILFVIFSIITVTFLWLPLNDSDCDATAFLASKTAKTSIQATKVVVKPWLGEHHVYGIFMVPEKYRRSPIFVLNVKDAISNCEEPFGELQAIDGISAQPGTYLIRDFIRTRLTLRLILQGKYNQINDPSHWTLIYPGTYR